MTPKLYLKPSWIVTQGSRYAQVLLKESENHYTLGRVAFGTTPRGFSFQDRLDCEEQAREIIEEIGPLSQRELEDLYNLVKHHPEPPPL